MSNDTTHEGEAVAIATTGETPADHDAVVAELAEAPVEAPVEVPAEDEEQSIEEVARAVAALTWERKALNTVVIDLRGRVYYTDFLVICEGTSDRQMQAIVRHVDTAMRTAGYRPIATEGVDSGRWALVDYGDIILHVFNQSSRQEFDLEGMWLEAPRLELEDKPETLYGHFDLAAYS